MMRMKTQMTLYLTAEEKKALQDFAFLVLYDDNDTIKDLDCFLSAILDGHEEDTVNNIRIVTTEEED